MITAVGLTAISLFCFSADTDAAFPTRVENAKLEDSKGEPFPRIERDAEGKITKLTLSKMQLSADDFAAIGRVKSLRILVLNSTNVTNADLRKLCDLPALEGINLTSTEVTDEAIDSLLKAQSLKSVCLGDVAISPGAVARLKEHFKKQDKRLALGYAQRK